jgi:hypothetical protein
MQREVNVARMLGIVLPVSDVDIESVCVCVCVPMGPWVCVRVCVCVCVCMSERHSLQVLYKLLSNVRNTFCKFDRGF